MSNNKQSGVHRLALTAAVVLALIGPCPHVMAADDDVSEYPACNEQYRRDREICQKVKKRACWASMMDRLGYCNRTRGKTGTPSLVTQ